MQIARSQYSAASTSAIINKFGTCEYNLPKIHVFIHFPSHLNQICAHILSQIAHRIEASVDRKIITIIWSFRGRRRRRYADPEWASTYLSKIDVEEERFFGVRNLNSVLLKIFTVYLLHCFSFHCHFSLSKHVNINL